MSEIDKLKDKAKLLGLDVDLLINEIAGVVSQSIPVPQVDMDYIVDKLRESLPEGGGAEFDAVRVQADIEAKLGKQMEELVGAIKGRLDGIKQEIMAGLDAAIETKLMQYKNEMVAAVRGGMPSNNGGQGGQGETTMPQDRWSQALMVLDRFLDRQDPLANIENLSNIYARLGAVFGGGPDPTTLYRGNQQAFIEGIKVGAKAKGGVVTPSPLLSNQPAEPLTRRVRPTSRIDKIIREL